MKKLILVTLSIVLFYAATSKAQTKTATGTFAVKISEIIDLTVSSGNALTFDFNDMSKLDNGIEQLNAVTLTSKSNQPWFVSVKANAANFTGGDVTTPMPASVIKFKNADGGTYLPLSTTDAALSGTAGSKNPRGTSTIKVDYRLDPGYAYGPASDYAMTITYTISKL
ncbi:MAG TPA: hypothetical protein VEV16_05320 [Daejeonella sp.]|nr:hypothetical protein [Daejeonella sp.]